MKQYYEISLLLPANGSINSLTTTQNNTSYPSLTLPKGTIDKLFITVPVGANQAVFFQLRINNMIVFPTSSNVGNFSIMSNSVATEISFQYSILASNSTADIWGYNISTTNSYIITIGIEEEV